MDYLQCLSGQDWAATNPGGNYSTSGYPTRVATITAPSGDGVIPVGETPGGAAGGIEGAKHLVLVPYGIGTSSETFAMQVLGWRKTHLNVGTPLWIPVSICTLAVTLGSNVSGVANSDLGSTVLFASGIVMTGAPLGVSSAFTPTSEDFFTIAPTGSQGAAWAKIPTFGFRYVEVIFTTGGSVTSCNCLWQKGSF